MNNYVKKNFFQEYKEKKENIAPDEEEYESEESQKSFNPKPRKSKYIKRTCRQRNTISYKFEDFDDMIDKAIKQEVEEVKEYKKHNYGNYIKQSKASVLTFKDNTMGEKENCITKQKNLSL